MLRFDFSGLNTDDVDLLYEEFHNRIFQSCNEFIERYQITVTLEKGSSAADCMSSFISKVKHHLQVPIYLIIDE